MGKLTTTRKESSSAVWEYLEELVRMKVREFIQTLLEDEVTELLRRGKSERRDALDSPPVYRNGYGKGRKLTLGCGTITVRRHRERGLEERFESRILLGGDSHEFKDDLIKMMLDTGTYFVPTLAIAWAYKDLYPDVFSGYQPAFILSRREGLV